MVRTPQRRIVHVLKLARIGARVVLREDRGSALLEFAITLPLLVVFVVGIYDFSDAFNQKQKIAQAAQEGAILAGAQPRNDIQQNNPNPSPDSLQPVVTSIFNSLAAGNLLPNANTGTCKPPGAATQPTPLQWQFKISGCSGTPTDDLVITVNRATVCISGPNCSAGPPVAVGTVVTVRYPYHWRFGSVIQLLFPGPNSYLTPTQLTESATVQNQM